MKLATKLFFLSGDDVANRLGASEADDRDQIHTLIDMLGWNVLVMVDALVIVL